MKLKFLKPYLSVKDFADIEVESFSLYTGLNGAGKTHLLQAIKAGNIQVSDFGANEIVYFNYNDFIVNTEAKSHSSIQPQHLRTNIDASRLARLAEYRNHVMRLGDELGNDPIDRTIIYFLIHASINESSFEEIFGSPKDYELLEKEKIRNEGRVNTNMLNGSVSQAFTNFISNYHSRGGYAYDWDYESIKGKVKYWEEDLTQKVLDSGNEYFDFLKRTLPKSKSIIGLSYNDFEHINLFESDLSHEIKLYIIRESQNALQRFKSERQTGVHFLSNEEFLLKWGKSPLILMNEVLEEYDCNGYYLHTEWSPEYSDAHMQKTIPIEIRHRREPYITNFSHLSSGEQTLLAIALMVYKARKGCVFPRMLLLDEIDAALHPSMIKRLLGVLQKVFYEDKGLKIMMVTHSPTTVALFPSEIVYVVDKNSEPFIQKKQKAEAIEFLSEGFATLEEGVKLLDQIGKCNISIITEGNNTEYLKRANSIFGSDDIEIVEGLESKTGKDQLRSLYTFFSKVPHDKKVVIAWDYDANNFSSLTSTNKTYPFIFTKNELNNKIKRGIENLFPESLFDARFYKLDPDDEYGGRHTTFDKKAFKKYIIDNGTQQDFINFKPFFDFIKSIK
ncbi:MAG: ATP-binding protein [Bacteroidetes bacterium]|nr:ATP-binding protein [Bacteroidota bacterium]